MNLSFTPLLLLAVVALLVGLVLGGLGGLALGRWVLPACAACPETECQPTIYPERPPCDCEAEYYRGIFDTWMWVKTKTGRAVNIWAAVRAALASDWYTQPSPDWTWPVPDPTVTPTPQGVVG